MRIVRSTLIGTAVAVALFGRDGAVQAQQASGDQTASNQTALQEVTVTGIRAALEESGMPEYLSAKFGDDVNFTYHDGSDSLGHDIEVHADSEGLRGFFSMFEEAADGWDGSGDLVRPAFS